MKPKNALVLLAAVTLTSLVGGGVFTSVGADDSAPPPATAAAVPPAPALAKCPVTGEEFPVTPDTLHSLYKGKEYYFCCPPCKMQFDREPEKYLQGK